MPNEAAVKTDDKEAPAPDSIDKTEEQPELKVVEKPQPITQSRFQLDVEANTCFRATVPEGVTPGSGEDSSKPNGWGET